MDVVFVRAFEKDTEALPLYIIYHTTVHIVVQVPF